MSLPVTANLQAFRANVTSQFGEDGVLAEILRRLGEGEKRCVEFGAWDGRHYSNTWSLWHERGWSAVLIEGELERYVALRDRLIGFPHARALHAFVSWEGENKLDALLRGSGVSGPIDVMSIDIDGDDYHVLAAVKEFLPRILLVEFNPTCPPGSEFVQAKGGRFGSSASSLLLLAQDKGYALAACTDTNLILVRNEEFARLEIPPVSLDAVAPTAHLAYLMTDYDGQPYLNRLPVYMPELPAAAWRPFGKPSSEWTSFEKGVVKPIRVTRAGR